MVIVFFHAAARLLPHWDGQADRLQQDEPSQLDVCNLKG
jgi:hypothetical protein